MTNPVVETIKRDGSRFYVHPETNAKVLGVTSITRNLPKPFLQYWGQKLVAEETVDDLGSITQLMGAGNRDPAMDMLKHALQSSTGNVTRIDHWQHNHQNLHDGQN